MHDAVIFEKGAPPKKPVIIAICGKSASGKDTLAHWLLSMLKINNIPASLIVSDTTRPPRIFEEDGNDYNFLTEEEFNYKIKNNSYLEYSSFNQWLYGTDKISIIPKNINIGVFNLDGMSSLANYQNDFEVICVYLKCGLIKRLIRSYERERKFKIEYIRRAYMDYHDFKNIKDILRLFPNQFYFNCNLIPTVTMVDHIIWRLKMKNLLPHYNKS